MLYKFYHLSSFFFNKNINFVYFSGEKMHTEAFRGVDFFGEYGHRPVGRIEKKKKKLKIKSQEVSE